MLFGHLAFFGGLTIKYLGPTSIFHGSILKLKWNVLLSFAYGTAEHSLVDKSSQLTNSPVLTWLKSTVWLSKGSLSSFIPTTVATDLHPHSSSKLPALVILEEQVWKKSNSVILSASPMLILEVRWSFVVNKTFLELHSKTALELK